MRVQVSRSVLELVLELVQGDITRQQVDAVVNAANSQLAGGGGVDGAIHRAAGPSVMEETGRLYPAGCPPGSAVASGAGQLPVKKIIHAVGPVWRGGQQGEPELLKSAYQKCLDLAGELDCDSIAFPAISAGVYGYPRDLAAQHALETVWSHLNHRAHPPLVRFVLFDAGMYGAFARVLETLQDAQPWVNTAHG
jgi:O-acetyl-ADP-ribose deacetylase (regulator of RNase III)